MDPRSRRIIRALLVVLLLAAVAFAASLFVPYDVTFDATITDLDGTALLLIPNRNPRELSQADGDPIPLRLEQALQLEPGSSATLTFAINGGYVDIEGPAMIRLAQSQRTATTIGHLRDSGDYTLIIEQDGGTARYYFDNADPTLEQSDVAVRINRTATDTITFSDPCWLTSTSADGTAVSHSIACP